MDTTTFWSRVEKTASCWIWVGHVYKGYGRYGGQGAHRVAYELHAGAIPEGMELDHLCRNPLCVNPDHLEPVTRAENIRRRSMTVTHCRRGHPLDERNTYHHRGRRQCRACNRRSVRKYRLARTRLGVAA